MSKISKLMVSDQSLRGRLSARTKEEGGCLIWTGSVRGYPGNQYGTISYKGKTLAAHRVAWQLANHETDLHPSDRVCHTCDNPRCVRSEHLFVGTQADNMQDMVEKGRHFWAKRERCINGHEFTPENTRVYKNGRVCRACFREHSRRKVRAKQTEFEPIVQDLYAALRDEFSLLRDLALPHSFRHLGHAARVLRDRGLAQDRYSAYHGRREWRRISQQEARLAEKRILE